MLPQALHPDLGGGVICRRGIPARRNFRCGPETIEVGAPLYASYGENTGRYDEDQDQVGDIGQHEHLRVPDRSIAPEPFGVT